MGQNIAIKATRSLSLNPINQRLSEFVAASDIIMPSFDFARDSIRLPQFKHSKSGILNLFIFVDQILLLVQYHSSSIVSCPNLFSFLITFSVPTAPIVILSRKLQSS